MRAASIICAAVAVIVCAWFALGARQAIDLSRAAGITNQVIAHQRNHATAAQERRVSSLVHSAQLLNPDEQPRVLLGQVETEHGEFARAERVLVGVTRSEPQNLEGWVWLAHASGSDRPVFNSALRHVHRLEPHPAE